MVLWIKVLATKPGFQHPNPQGERREDSFSLSSDYRHHGKACTSSLPQ